jgi:imidazolonepropionase-like amidohydrolase
MAFDKRYPMADTRYPIADSRYPITDTRWMLLAASALTLAATFAAPALQAHQSAAAPVYAIQGAKIVSAGTTIEKGNLIMRNGLIEAVGANAAIPADAVVVDAANMTVYPGLIDMTNTSVVEPRPASAAAAAPEASAEGPGQGGGRGRGGAAAAVLTWADADRAKRDLLLTPQFEAAHRVRYEGVEMQRLAAAGITSVLAVGPTGLFHGESALVNVVAPPDEDDISRVASYRRGSVVIASPVAQHVTFTVGRGGGGGYPAALLGDIAFVRQAFYDAKWQKDARAWAEKHKDQPRPAIEPALDALVPALERKMPVSFEAGELREILRALALAKEFNLDPIVTGGVEADQAVSDLKAANARVILTVASGNPAPGGRGGPSTGSGQGRGGDTPIRVTHMRQNAPKVPAALEKAGIPYAFASEGTQTPAEFLRGVARAVREGGLTADQALRALTVNAAKIAGADVRVGTLAKGKIANVLVVDGDLFSDAPKIRRVFVDGRPVNIDLPPAQAPGGGRRGGH